MRFVEQTGWHITSTPSPAAALICRHGRFGVQDLYAQHQNSCQAPGWQIPSLGVGPPYSKTGCGQPGSGAVQTKGCLQAASTRKGCE